jgi:hypothetical protein
MLGRIGRGFAAVIGAVLVLGAMVGPALGATRPLTLDIVLDDFCAIGTAKPNTVIKYVIKDSSGAIKGRDAQMSDGQGFWSACVDFFADGFATGDKFKITDYDTNQTLNYTIPRLTLSVDRKTDVVSGRAPAGATVELEAADFNTPLFGKDPYDVIDDVTANGGSSYSHDFGNDGVDLMTGAYLEARLSGAGGNVMVRRDMSVPGLYMLLGTADFQGYMRPYYPIGITLKVGGMQVASGHGVGDEIGQFRGKLVDGDGDQYHLMGGESLKAPKLGISWTVPTINGSANRQTDVVSGTCFPNAVWAVVAGDFGFANGTTGASGHFSVDMSDQQDLVKGDFVAIGCFTNAGDLVEQDLTVQ